MKIKKVKTAIVTSLRLGKGTGKGDITSRLSCYYVENAVFLLCILLLPV